MDRPQLAASRAAAYAAIEVIKTGDNADFVHRLLVFLSCHDHAIRTVGCSVPGTGSSDAMHK